MAAARLNESRDFCALKASEIALLEAWEKSRGIAQAAQALGIGSRTAANRLAEIRGKLFVKSTEEALAVWRGVAQ